MKKLARLLKKTLKWLLILTLLLVVIVLGASYYLLGSEHGIKQLITLNNKYSPAKIEVESFSGDFIGDIFINNITVTHPSFTIKSSEAELVWLPKSLFSRDLIIEKLRVKDSELTLTPNPTPAPTEPTNSEPTELSDISIPADIFINHLEVDNFTVVNQDSRTTIEQVLTKLSYVDSKVSIDSLQFAMPEPMVSLNSSGELTTLGDYPLTLNNEISTDIPSFGVQTFNISSTGALKTTLKNIIASSGDLDFQLTNELQDLFTTPQLSGELAVKSINLEPFQLTDSTVSANLTYQGSIENMNLAGNVNYDSPDTGPLQLALDTTYQGDTQTVSIDKVLLTLLEAQQQLALAGTFDITNTGFDIDLNSDGIAWPQTNPFVQLATTNGTVSGTPDDYQIKLASTVSGEGLPTTALEFNSAGSTTGLSNFNLASQLLDGELDVSGQFDWQPYLNLRNGKIITKNINPNSLVPDIQASINSDIDVSFNNENQGYNAELKLNQLDGTLQSQPIKGSGEVLLVNNALDIKALSIDLAQNLLNANGQLSQESANIDFTLDAKKLNNLVPELQGAVNLAGNVKGSLQQPSVNVSGGANNVSFQGNSVENLTLKAVLDLASEQVDLVLNAKQLKSGETVVNATDLAIKGTIPQHTLNAKVDSSIAQLELSGAGGLDLDQLEWAGNLTTLAIDEPNVGKWQLRQKTALKAGKTAVNLGDFCLTQLQSALCVNGDYNLVEGNGDFKVNVSDISSDLFKSYLPEMIELTTTLDLVADVKLTNNQPNINGKLSQKNGQLVLKSAGKDVTSKIEKFDIDFRLANNKLDASAAVVLEKLLDIGLNATLNDIQKSQFNSELMINNIAFAPFQPLVPMLDNLAGEINGKLSVGGAYDGNMQMSGGIALSKGQFDFAEYGTQIRDIQLTVDAQSGNTLAINGGLKSGNGELKIDGMVDPFKPTVDINIKGSDLNVANTNKLKVDISPDLTVSMAETLRINGEVVIPRAMISPESSGSKVSASEDVVITNQAKEKEATSPIEADIAIKLGDDVKISSADIETQLFGGININLTPNQAPSASGTIEVRTGEYRVFGQKLNIDRGRIIFGKGAIANPRLDIRVSREIEADDVIVGANILGHVNKTKIDLFSTPGMPDSSILSYLLFGKAPSSDTFSQTAAMQTGALIGANSVAKNIKEGTGLDVLEFGLSGFEAGKNITEDLYTGIETNFFDNISEFLLRYSFTKRLSFETNVGTEDSGFDFIYSYEKD